MYIHCTVAGKVFVNLNLFLKQFIRTFSFKLDIPNTCVVYVEPKNAYRCNVILMFLWINIRSYSDMMEMRRALIGYNPERRNV